MTSIKKSYTSGTSATGSYFYEYEYEYKIPSTMFYSLPVSGSGKKAFSITEDSEGTVKRVLGYGINLI